MTHTAAIKSDIEAGDTFATFSERTAQSVVFARENSFVPVDKALGTITSAVSEHSVMFIYNKANVNSSCISVSDLSRDMLPQTSTMFDLMLTVVEGSGGLEISATFNAKKFAVDFMEKLGESYLRLLERVSQKCTGKAVQELLGVSTIGREETEAFANLLKPEAPVDSTLLHEVFETRAALVPSAMAIDGIANGQRTVVSYAELNDRVCLICLALNELTTLRQASLPACSRALTVS